MFVSRKRKWNIQSDHHFHNKSVHYLFMASAQALLSQFVVVAVMTAKQTRFIQNVSIRIFVLHYIFCDFNDQKIFLNLDFYCDLVFNAKIEQKIFPLHLKKIHRWRMRWGTFLAASNACRWRWPEMRWVSERRRWEARGRSWRGKVGRRRRRRTARLVQRLQGLTACLHGRVISGFLAEGRRAVWMRERRWSFEKIEPN